MIRVRIKRKAGHVVGLTVSGHAGRAPSGEDLVCAAVSVLAQTYFFSLQRLLNLKMDANVDDGFLSFALPGNISPETQKKATLLAESMLVGFDEVNSSYPGFIEVSEE